MNPIRAILAVAAALWLGLASVDPARAAQGSGCMPTVGVVSGLTFANDINAAIAALISSNSGNSAPATDCSAAAVQGQFWLDTTSGQYKRLKYFDGTSWLIVATLDATNHLSIEPIGGGTASIASAGTTDLWSTPEAGITVTGTTTITALASASAVPGTLKIVKFSGALTLTYNASSLILPTAANITTVAGDYAIVLALTSTNVAVLSYNRGDGTAISTSAVFAAAVNFNGVIAPTALAANTNNYAPTGLSTANVMRVTTSASSSINITGLTAPATNGQRLIIANDNASGAAACSSGTNCSFVLTANDTNSTAANRFCLARPYVVTPQKSVTIVYGTSASGFTAGCWRLEQSFEAPAIAGGFKNAKLTNGGTPNNQLIYTADELTVEDVNGAAVRLSSVSCTADVTASGAAGLDTGSVAQNTGYYFWVIFNPATNTQSCMFSTASALGSITFPAGYTHAARTGWDFVENLVGKRLNRILCFGRRCQYVVTTSTATANMPIMDSGAKGAPATPTWVSASTASVAPATASRIFIFIFGNGGGNTIAAPNASYGALASTSNPPPCQDATSASSGQGILCEFALEASSVQWASSGGNGILAAFGWEDNL